MIGRTISHYIIRERLGRGGMGVVYRAEDTRLRRGVALKFVAPEVAADPAARARLTREAQAAAALDHPHICPIYGIEEAGDELFIVMALVEGEDLATRVERGPLPLDEALDLAEQIADGLRAAHEHGVVHRDIKPANIMIGAGGQVRILDFGLATSADLTRLTAPGTTLGTAAYMAPEQVRGEEADRRADIWSLGVLLHEMIVGQRPFRGENGQAVLRSILEDDPPPPTSLRSGLPIELDRILEKALSKDPAERYQHADELLADLRRLRSRLASGATARLTAGLTATAGGSAGGGAGPTRPAPAPSGVRPRRRVAFLGVPLVLVAAVAAVLFGGPLVCNRETVAQPIPIAVVSFENQTGDPAYDYLQLAVPNLLITSLEESPRLRVMTWERMQDLARSAGRPEPNLIDRELGFELCRRGGIETIVIGTLTRAGDTFATDVKVLDVGTKDLLASASAQGRGVDSILESQIDAISRDIRRATGITQRRVPADEVPIAELTTTSLDAYRLYLRGREATMKLYNADARRDLRAAVEMDSTFVEAWFYLARACFLLGHRTEGLEAITTAHRLSDRAGEKARLYVAADYARYVDGDDEEAGRILSKLVERYPEEKGAYYLLAFSYRHRGRNADAIQALEKALVLDPEYPVALNLAAYCYTDEGDVDRALRYLERYTAVQPGDANPYDSMGDLHFRSGNVAQAQAMYERGLVMRPDFSATAEKLAYLAALTEDYAGAIERLDAQLAVLSTPGEKLWIHWWKGVYLNWLGREAEAAHEYGLASAQAEEVGSGWSRALVLWSRGILARDRGDLETARACYDGVDSLNVFGGRLMVKGIFLCFRGALALDGGDMAEAGRVQAGIDSLRSEAPEGERGILVLLSDQLRGRMFVAGMRYQEALASLELDQDENRWFRLGVTREVALFNMLDLDALARVYLALGRTQDAVAEYERLTSPDPADREMLFVRPVHHYRLGLLYESQGRTAEAAERYRRFVDLWSGADRPGPELADARARLAALGA